jgi:tRNA A37 methylthiotransferase MiaB
MKKVKFINSYSYIFSARPGTPSAKLEIVDLNLAKKKAKTHTFVRTVHRSLNF